MDIYNNPLEYMEMDDACLVLNCKPTIFIPPPEGMSNQTGGTIYCRGDIYKLHELYIQRYIYTNYTRVSVNSVFFTEPCDNLYIV